MQADAFGGQERNQEPTDPLRNQCAERSAHDGKDEALGDELMNEPTSRCANRHANRELTLPTCRACQHQIGNVGARNHQHQGTDGQQNVERRFVVASKVRHARGRRERRQLGLAVHLGGVRAIRRRHRAVEYGR